MYTIKYVTLSNPFENIYTLPCQFGRAPQKVEMTMFLQQNPSPVNSTQTYIHKFRLPSVCLVSLLYIYNHNSIIHNDDSTHAYDDDVDYYEIDGDDDDDEINGDDEIDGDVEDDEIDGDVEDDDIDGDVEEGEIDGDVEDDEIDGDVEDDEIDGDVEDGEIDGDDDYDDIDSDVDDKDVFNQPGYVSRRAEVCESSKSGSEPRIFAMLQLDLVQVWNVTATT